MLRVWADERPVGAIDRFKTRGCAFSYDPASLDDDAVSVTMPRRVASWNTDFGLAPISDMNLPEGALRALLTRRFAKAAGAFDDFDLLSIVGRAQIGRLRYSAPGASLDADIPFQSVDEIIRARRDGGLFNYLLEKFAPHSGLSGVQPKVMIRGVDDAARQSQSVGGATHIVKFWDANEFAELAANEFYCLTAARAANLRVPVFALSDDGGALIVERFDLKGDGGYLGFEDFTVLNGVTAEKKYEGGYETRLFKRVSDFVKGSGQATALAELFRLFAFNCAIGNGDAHLKNFGITYTTPRGAAALAPAYDLVTTRAYIPVDKMALTLNGGADWPDSRKLMLLGQTRANLGGKQVSAILEEIADALSATASLAKAYFGDKSPITGERMMAAWAFGVKHCLGQTRDLRPGAAIVY